MNRSWNVAACCLILFMLMQIISCSRSTKAEQLVLNVSPESGNWLPEQEIVVVCSQPDARIYYT